MLVVFYTVNMYMCIYDLFHILLSLWHTKDLWNVCVCMYVLMYVCISCVIVVNPVSESFIWFT